MELQKGQEALAAALPSGGIQFGHGFKIGFNPFIIKQMSGENNSFLSTTQQVFGCTSYGSTSQHALTQPCEEAFIEECELRRSDLIENRLTIEGEYYSETYMREELKWSELLGLI